MSKSHDSVARYRKGDKVILRGVGPGTVTETAPLSVRLDAKEGGAYRAGVGRGSIVQVTDLNRIKHTEREDAQ
jgi:hypothetical protein